MKSRSILSLGLILGLGIVASLPVRAAEASSQLAGTWTLDIARSTPIRPWDKESMTIAVTGDTVAITRNLAWGADRKVSDVTTAKTDAEGRRLLELLGMPFVKK